MHSSHGIFNINDEIMALIGEYARIGLSPQEINDGNCDEFACTLESQGFGMAIWGDELCIILWSDRAMRTKDWFTHFAPSHCFVQFENKYYDCECPEGAEFPDDLPFYQREYNSYGAE